MTRIPHPLTPLLYAVAEAWAILAVAAWVCVEASGVVMAAVVGGR